jgi:hypothetical protein
MQDAQLYRRETPDRVLLYVPSGPPRGVPASYQQEYAVERSALNAGALAGIVSTSVLLVVAAMVACYVSIWRRGKVCCWPTHARKGDSADGQPHKVCAVAASPMGTATVTVLMPCEAVPSLCVQDVTVSLLYSALHCSLFT